MGKAVLIVDDEPTFVESVKEFLEFKGYDVEAAESGERALEVLNYRRVDIILLDIMMPGLDGYDFMRRLRSGSRTKATPVIVTTAVPKFRGEQRMASLGAAAYLEKPFDNSKLVELIERHTT